MTLSLDQSTQTTVIAIITGVGSAGTVIWFTIVHFRVLRILRSLIARLPLALANEIIREATSTEEKPLTDKRGSPRVSCHFFVRKEHFNEKLDAAIDSYQRASTYPLKSRVSIAAVGLWFLIVVVLGVYFIGNPGAAQGDPSSTTVASNQVSSLTLTNSQTNVQSSQIVAGGTSVTPAAHANADKSIAAFKNGSLVVLSVGVAFMLLAVCLVLCYHFGVFGILVEDVVTLCETVGLVTVKSATDGTALIDKIIPAKDDPEFNALLRLTKKND